MLRSGGRFVLCFVVAVLAAAAGSQRLYGQYGCCDQWVTTTYACTRQTPYCIGQITLFSGCTHYAAFGVFFAYEVIGCCGANFENLYPSGECYVTRPARTSTLPAGKSTEALLRSPVIRTVYVRGCSGKFTVATLFFRTWPLDEPKVGTKVLPAKQGGTRGWPAQNK